MMGARAVEMIVNDTEKQDENAMSINLPLMIIERKSA
jgi:DNA-binding LacI/PurR family transcriptional regulator